MRALILTAAAIAGAVVGWFTPGAAREIAHELDEIDAESAREHDESGEWAIPDPPPALTTEARRPAA